MSEVVLSLAGAGKMYKLFASPRDNLLEAAGLARFMSAPAREFWALRGIDFELRRGERLGIVGRNGAGKSTVLKLLTQNLAPTEGMVKVRGKVHALMDAGAGFNLELTGARNVAATLAYQGLDRRQIEEAAVEIREFTELGGFFDQPLKTYSLGMLARLAFATATTTAVHPEILVVDEVLGAGDAYFFGKSTERMQRLVEDGASVVIVSHALDQIVRLCPEALWLDRGRIVDRGPSLEVVKAYQQFVRTLEDRRLRARNRKRPEDGFSFEQSESRSDTLAVRLVLQGEAGAECQVERIAILRDGEVEEEVFVGAPQDSDPSHPAFVVLEGGAWSPPARSGRGAFRSLTARAAGEPAAGSAAIGLFHLDRESRYAVDCTYRSSGARKVGIELWHGGTLAAAEEFVGDEAAWVTRCVALPRTAGGEGAGAPLAGTSPADGAETPGRAPAVRRWPGQGALSIEAVTLVDRDGAERALFEAGAWMTLRMRIRAARGGTYAVTPAATLYRADGILVTNLVGDAATLALEEGAAAEARLDLGPLNLGDGRYVFSVAIYRRLSALEGSEWYDLLDRSYEFEVAGNRPFDDGVFRHGGTWHVDRADGN